MPLGNGFGYRQVGRGLVGPRKGPRAKLSNNRRDQVFTRQSKNAVHFWFPRFLCGPVCFRIAWFEWLGGKALRYCDSFHFLFIIVFF